MRRSVYFTSFLLSIILLPCCIAGSKRTDRVPSGAASALTHNTESEAHAATESNQTLLLTFAGDLMAHTVNFNMKSYDLIYTDIEKILHADDLSFVNVETPVCDALPLSSYPCFNVHTPYLRAAVQAGFDVLSFANNHTNDQQTTGIDGSLAAVRTLQKELSAVEAPRRLLAFSGLKDGSDEPIEVTRITYKGWNILFCAVTELLNSYDSSKKRLYYSAPTKQGRDALLSVIKEARATYPCDLFVLGLHLNEPEYVRTVSEAKKAWFKQLGEGGVDIIWAHHPHVMQTWETITVERPQSSDTSDTPDNTKHSLPCKVFCMYSMGNFISGQRWHTRYDDPTFYREYTGDAVLLQLTYTRNKAGSGDFSVHPILITQYNEAEYPVVKRFTHEWMETLNEKDKKYFNRRFELMKEYLPL